MSTHNVPAGFRPVRRDQLREEREHDTYKLRQKLAEPSVCPECGAVFHNGRWQWSERPEGAAETVCAACHRVKDGLPAGFVHIGGPYFGEHRDEITALIRHREEREKSQHPMARVMGIEAEDDGILVTTTDIHLARDIGEALERACDGTLDYHYNEGEKLLRVHWRR